jgi:hypothetical protein
MLALAAAPDIATAGDRNAPENRSDTPVSNILTRCLRLQSIHFRSEAATTSVCV